MRSNSWPINQTWLIFHRSVIRTFISEECPLAHLQVSLQLFRPREAILELHEFQFIQVLIPCLHLGVIDDCCYVHKQFHRQREDDFVFCASFCHFKDCSPLWSFSCCRWQAVKLVLENPSRRFPPGSVPSQLTCILQGSHAFHSRLPGLEASTIRLARSTRLTLPCFSLVLVVSLWTGCHLGSASPKGPPRLQPDADCSSSLVLSPTAQLLLAQTRLLLSLQAVEAFCLFLRGVDLERVLSRRICWYPGSLSHPTLTCAKSTPELHGFLTLMSSSVRPSLPSTGGTADPINARRKFRVGTTPGLISPMPWPGVAIVGNSTWADLSSRQAHRGHTLEEPTCFLVFFKVTPTHAINRE